MLTLKDAIDYSELTEEEIDAIAEHEHVPEIIAVELGTYLVHSEDGVPMLKRMILDDIEALSGMVLGCYCSPQRCHADELAERANQEDA